MDRRAFLARTGLVTAAGAAVLPGFRYPDAGNGSGGNRPTCDDDTRTWDIPPSTMPADPRENPIESIGVLMMENRSYDTYFGWYEGGRGFLNLGLELEYTDPDDGQTARPEHWAPQYRRCGHPDPAHGWDSGRDQLRNGFLAGRNDEYALAYYLAEDIPIYSRLVRQFTLFDDYYCSLLASTYPNRFYQHSAQSGGLRGNSFPPEEGHYTGFDWPSIWHRLDAAGISWAYYYSDLPFIAMWGGALAHGARPISQFFVDAATGNLPQVYFVDPKFLPPYQVDDHPSGSDVQGAQGWVSNVMRAVVNSPQWARSAFFINYDEWGGFFDHVVPPSVPDVRSSENLDDDYGQLGFRVPCIALSPYSRKGYVHHAGPYDHTSILKFISYKFELEPLTVRDAESPNIGEAFDYTQAPRLDFPGWDAIAPPEVYDTVDCNYQPEPPADFVRFAESPWVRDQGYEIGEPTAAELYGTADSIAAAIAAAGGPVGPAANIYPESATSLGV